MGQEGKDALKNFKAFWTDYKAKANELTRDNKIHPEDRANIKHQITIDSATTGNQIKGNYIITNEQPDPCCGDIKNAKFIFLSGNPDSGIDIKNFNAKAYLSKKEEEEGRHKPAETKNPNVNRKKFDYLDKSQKHNYKGAYGYWHPTFKKMIKEYAEELKIDCADAQNEIAKATCVLESLCYASSSRPSFDKNKIKSSELIKEVLHKYLMPKAQRGKILIFSWRSSEFWGIEDHEGDNIIIRPRKTAENRRFINNEKDVIRKFLIQKRQLWPCIISSLKTRLCRS